MTRIAARRTLLTGAALAVAAVLIAGCSSQDSSSSASAQPTSPASAAQSPTASSDAAATASAGSSSTAPTSAASFKRVPMQTATGGEFVSPSNNISCQVGLTNAMCLTGTPAQSVTMGVSGSYTTCTGDQCLSNAGDGTPTLAYGTETGVGPFLCESTTAGVTCTITSGKGFQISRSGITSVTG